jgi:hypothetical protein
MTRFVYLDHLSPQRRRVRRGSREIPHAKSQSRNVHPSALCIFPALPRRGKGATLREVFPVSLCALCVSAVSIRLVWWRWP